MSVRVKGLDSLVSRIKEYPDKMQKAVDSVLSAGAVSVAGLGAELAPYDEGRLRQGQSANTTTFLSKQVTNNVFYAPYVEFGTGRKVKVPPGLEDVAAQFKGPAGQGNFEQMVDRLMGWVRRKGIAGTYSVRSRRRLGNPLRQAIEERQLAIFLAKRILKNGIKPQPFFFRALDALEPDILKNVKKAIEI